MFLRAPAPNTANGASLPVPPPAARLVSEPTPAVVPRPNLIPLNLASGAEFRLPLIPTPPVTLSAPVVGLVEVVELLINTAPVIIPPL